MISLDENMQLICDLFAKTLQATRDCSNLKRIKYKDGEVHIVFSNRVHIISVDGDSEIAMISDILREVWW